MQTVDTTQKDGELFVATPHAVWGGPIDAVLKRIVNPVAGARYDLEPRATRFLVLESAAAGSSPPLSHPMIVLGWAIPRD